MVMVGCCLMDISSNGLTSVLNCSTEYLRWLLEMERDLEFLLRTSRIFFFWEDDLGYGRRYVEL